MDPGKNLRKKRGGVTQVRLTLKQRAERMEAQRQCWIEEGKRRGLTEAREKAVEDIKLQTIQANLDLARTLSSMVESTARAVITFISEGGVRT